MLYHTSMNNAYKYAYIIVYIRQLRYVNRFDLVFSVFGNTGI